MGLCVVWRQGRKDRSMVMIPLLEVEVSDLCHFLWKECGAAISRHRAYRHRWGWTWHSRWSGVLWHDMTGALGWWVGRGWCRRWLMGSFMLGKVWGEWIMIHTSGRTHIHIRFGWKCIRHNETREILRSFINRLMATGTYMRQHFNKLRCRLCIVRDLGS